MGTLSKQESFHLGEVEFLPNATSIATIFCRLMEDAQVSIIIQDEIGQACGEEKLELKQGEQSIEINTSDLRDGNYYAWIDILGRTFIRNFQVASSHDSNNIWFKRVKSFFG